MSGEKKRMSPNWEFMVYDKEDMQWGNCKRITCGFCGKTFAGNIGRVEKHLLQCRACDIEVQLEIQKRTNCKLRKKKERALARHQSETLRANQQLTMEKMLNRNTDICARLDRAVAKFILTGFHSFKLVEQPEFLALLKLAKQAPPDWKPPSAYLVAGRLLDDQYEETSRKSRALIAKAAGNSANTLVTDHMTDPSHANIQSFSAVSPYGATCLKILDMVNKGKSMRDIAGYIITVIKDTNEARSFYLAVLDGALRGTHPYVEREFPWLTCIWCNAHIISCIFKDIFHDIEDLRRLLADVTKVLHLVRDHQKLFDALRQLGPATPKFYCEVRFGSSWMVFNSMFKAKDALEQLVVCADFKVWFKKQDKTKRETAMAVKSIVQREGFFDDLAEFVAFAKPLYELLRMTDGAVPCLGKIHPAVADMLDFMNAASYQHGAKIVDLIDKRVPGLLTWIYHAGYLVN